MPSRKNQSYKFILLIFLLFFFSSPADVVSFIPDKIDLPSQLKKRTPKQIQAVFSLLEKQYNKKTANLWSLKYRKALLLKKKDTVVFCSLMKELAQAPAFPLKDLALIQSYEVCPYPEELTFSPDKFLEWMRLRLAEAFYKRRKLFENPDQTLKATVYLGQNSPYKDLKISYLKHALVLAKEQKKDLEIQRLKQILYRESPSSNPNPDIKDYFSVAEDFRKNRQFKKSMDFYIKTLSSLKSSFDEKNLSFKGLGRIYKIQRNSKKAVINSRQWSDWLLKENTEQSLTQYYMYQLELARQRWNLNENEKAIQLVTKVLKDPKSRFIVEKALYLRGLIYIQEKKTEHSLKDWNQAIDLLSKKRRRSNLLEKVLWKKAWLLRSQKDYKKALYSFRLLERINKNPYTKYRVLFWKGKTLQNLGRKHQAKRTFKQLIKKDHFGYYGLLARKMLDDKPVFQEKINPSEKFFFSGDRKAENIIRWLILFEESNLLSQFLDTQKNKFFNQKNQTEQEWLQMAWLWKKAKKYLEFFQAMEQMNDSVKAFFLKKHLHFLFPLDFSEEVEKASKKWKLPQAFILSIIRQESAFNIRARSTADAFGLMQLIPSTARQTARKFKIPYRNFRELYKPSKNILLGTAHLKSLLSHYNSFLSTVAAYNAGSTPLNRWREEMKELQGLEFIENIPYEETRTYVRLIIRNYIFYQNMLDDEEPWFSDWILQ